jgi:hypothetical protein
MTQKPTCLAFAADPPSRQRIESWLQSLGHQLIWVDDLNQLHSHPSLESSQLLIVHLTDQKALTLCQSLRANLSTALIPQVAMVDADQWRIAAYEAGMDAVLLTSSKPQDIHEQLHALLERKDFMQQCMAQQIKAAEQGQVKVRNVFSRYVSPQVVDRILTGSGEVIQGDIGQKLNASVLFADMRGFTGVAERLTATQVFELLNEFFALLTSVAVRHAGTVFNMAGDSLMVGFGVPLTQADASARSIRAACEMQTGFVSLAEQWTQRYGVEAGLGIGINHGEVISGNIGSAQYMSYTLIGDTVNIAARLSQRARAGEVLFTRELQQSLALSGVEIKVPIISLPPLTLRGRSNPIDICCVPIDSRIELPKQ